MAGQTNLAYIQRQLSEWVRAGKVQQLCRGLYALWIASENSQYEPLEKRT